MRTRSVGHGNGEGGFTLIELLAVVTILGIISFALTEALIVGFKTTDAVTTDVTRTVGIQALRSYFIGDGKRARQVSTGDTPCATASPPSVEVLLHLYSNDQGSATEVAYSLESDGPQVGQRQIVRTSCAAGGSRDRRLLGTLEFDPAGPEPLIARCKPVRAAATEPDEGPCPTAPGEPATITLRALTNRPKDPPVTVDLTVRRRTT